MEPPWLSFGAVTRRERSPAALNRALNRPCLLYPLASFDVSVQRPVSSRLPRLTRFVFYGSQYRRARKKWSTPLAVRLRQNSQDRSPRLIGNATILRARRIKGQLEAVEKQLDEWILMERPLTYLIIKTTMIPATNASTHQE